MELCLGSPVAGTMAHAWATHLSQSVQQIKQELARPLLERGAAISSPSGRCSHQEREALDDVKRPGLRLRRST